MRCELPILIARAPGDFQRLDDGFHSVEERKRLIKRAAVQRLSKRERAATPATFRDILIAMARSVAQPTQETP